MSTVADDAAADTAAVAPVHQRSLSEQSSTTASVSLSVNASYSGSLRRRPAAPATTVQKRRFRTQSSTLDSSSRRAPNGSSTTQRGEDVQTVTRHSRPVMKTSASAVAVDSIGRQQGKTNGLVLPSIGSAAAVQPSSTSRVQQSMNGSAAKKIELEKDGAAATMTEPVMNLSASMPTNTSTLTSGSHVVQRERSSALNRTAPPTSCSVADLTPEPTGASHDGAAESDGSSVKNSPQPQLPSSTSAPPTKVHSKPKTSGTEKASPATTASAAPSATQEHRAESAAASSTHTGTQTPLREATPQVSRRDSAVSAGQPGQVTRSPLSPVPVAAVGSAVLSTESSAALAPLRGPTHVGGGNTSSEERRGPVDGEKPRGSTPAAAAAATPPQQERRGSMLSTGVRRSPTAENTSSSVTLPRVASQTAAQRSSAGAAKAGDETPTADKSGSQTPVMQPLRAAGSGSAVKLQPHPPSHGPRSALESRNSTPQLQSLQVVAPTNAAAAAAAPSSSSTSSAAAAVSASQAAAKDRAMSRQSSGLASVSAPKGSKGSQPALQPAIESLYTAPIALRNFGATCYLNSIVQCLLHTPGLLRGMDKDRQRIIGEWEAKKGGRFDEAHRRSCAERHAPATSALIDLFTARPSQSTPPSQLLLSLKAACGECNDEFAGNGQNDAHEFLITLLGVIDQEISRTKPEAYQTMKDVDDECKRDAYARWTERLRRENDSTIYDFFGGVTGSTVQCSTCSLISYRFEALLDVSLPMTYNRGPRSANGTKTGKARPEEVVAVDLLLHDMFFSERGEFLSGPMQVTCDRCKKLRDKTIWSTIEQWPPILVLHLKRFNNAGVKNESAVVFPYTFCPFGRVKYQLYGVCLHRGTASFGHYTSYVWSDGEAVNAEAPPRSPTRANGSTSAGTGKAGRDDVDAFRSPPSGSFARSTEDVVGGPAGEECELPCGLHMSAGKSHHSSCGGGSGGGSSGGAGGSKRSGKWYLCNDEHITVVGAAEVVSKTKEAYILFYRRVA